MINLQHYVDCYFVIQSMERLQQNTQNRYYTKIQMAYCYKFTFQYRICMPLIQSVNVFRFSITITAVLLKLTFYVCFMMLISICLLLFLLFVFEFDESVISRVDTSYTGNKSCTNTQNSISISSTVL